MRSKFRARLIHLRPESASSSRCLWAGPGVVPFWYAVSALVARLLKVPDLRRGGVGGTSWWSCWRWRRAPHWEVGGDSVTAIWQWAARALQEKLGCLKPAATR